jgi:hypothetical protein
VCFCRGPFSATAAPPPYPVEPCASLWNLALPKPRFFVLCLMRAPSAHLPCWDLELCSAWHHAKKKSLIYAHEPGNTNPKNQRNHGPGAVRRTEHITSRDMQRLRTCNLYQQPVPVRLRQQRVQVKICWRPCFVHVSIPLSTLLRHRTFLCFAFA